MTQAVADSDERFGTVPKVDRSSLDTAACGPSGPPSASGHCMSEPDAHLLQGFERATEQIRRLVHVARLLIETMQRGERLPEATLTEYARQLTTVDIDTLRLEELIRSLWQLRGRTDGAH